MAQIQKFKVVLVGNQSVGKTSVVNRFIYDSYSESDIQPTVGIDFVSKTISIDNQTSRLQIWDTAGQERFKSLVPSYIRDSKGIILVYDQTKIETFKGLDQWISFIKEQRGDDVVVLLLANKSDIIDEKEVDEQLGKQKAQENNFLFYTVSAKLGQNIQQAFKDLTIKLLSQEIQEISSIQDSKINVGQQKEKKASCC